MTTINLKVFYPWYTHNEYIEASEEVADELRASRLYEAAYQQRIVRSKAQYSLDCMDGIEYFIRSLRVRRLELPLSCILIYVRTLNRYSTVLFPFPSAIPL